MTRNNTQAPEYIAAANAALAHEAGLHPRAECRTCKGKGRVKCPHMHADCLSVECPDEHACEGVSNCTVPCPDCGGAA